MAYDIGINDPKRILFFSSEKGLDDLERFEHWACDGTFKVCPTLWYQLVTIHVIRGGVGVPRLFA